ncbi:hypothetical protein [Bacillus sp. AK031]
MTLHHFIGANKKIPIGSFGRNPIYKSFSELNFKKVSVHKPFRINNGSKFVKVYETEEDASGIDVLALDPGYESVRNNFAAPFVYEVQGNLYANHTSAQRKSIKSLFHYIDNHLSEGDFMEVYSCLDGQEEKKRDSRKDVVIDLSTLEFGNHLTVKDINHLCESFFLENKQYVLVKKS